jgi:hypothetical protein
MGKKYIIEEVEDGPGLGSFLGWLGLILLIIAIANKYG